ncbi:acyl--CoA ligase [Candidatus Woesearchaeota archaeon]|nr:acyl--CoA ligase [Candidatus Woesearchaeota archaeon]
MADNLYEHISKCNKNSAALINCDEKGSAIENISYGQLKQRMEQTAAWLAELGLKENDTVGAAMRNSTELLILSWTCWSMGIITVPLDLKRDTLEQHKYKLKAAKAKKIIAEKGFAELEAVEYKPEGKTHASWKKGTEHLALILFTSGTTAQPKGVQLTMQNLLSNADAIKEWFKITEADRFIVELPLHHINSTTFCLAALMAGASTAIPPQYSNSRFWQQMAAAGATFTSIVPTICYDQLSREEEFEKYRQQLKLNRIQIGSAPVMASDVKKFMQKFGIPVYQGYGQTETSLRVTGVPLDLDKKLYEQLIESNSIGKPLKGIEVKIMDANDKGEGELAVKSAGVMKSYIGSSEGFRNGYFLTGDIGYCKEINMEKYYFLKGRSKEIIIKGGINISPAAVEDKLKQISADIEQVYAVGFPDKRYGEEVAAAICWKKNSSAELKNKLVSGTEKLSGYETPRYMAAIEAKDIPLTSTGKVQRALLKGLHFEPIDSVAESSEYKFIRLTDYHPDYVQQAFKLYNHCWQPLSADIGTFRQQMKNGIVIVAADNNCVRGLVTFIRTDLDEKSLSKTTYAKITANNTLSSHNSNGRRIVCTSICSSSYKPQPIKERSVSEEEVKKQLDNDPVYKFHIKPKGGFNKGAELVSIIPNSRPEDKRAAGYNMLMKYPEIGYDAKIKISSSGIATQLIEAVMIFAQQLGIKDVYVFSRPVVTEKRQTLNSS